MTPAPHPVRAGYRGPASLTPTPNQSARATSPAASVAGAFPKRTNAVKKPICYEGVIYPSQAALARELGLTPSTVSFAVRNGRLDTLGTGTKSGWENVKDSRCQPVAAHGWHWPSQKAAAKALNCAEDTVGDNLNRGTFDRLVLQRLGVKA